jgi:hypothetical protein
MLRMDREGVSRPLVLGPVERTDELDGLVVDDVLEGLAGDLVDDRRARRW